MDHHSGILEDSGSLEIASVPRRSYGTRWTPLSARQSWTGEPQPTGGKDSSQVRSSIAHPWAWSWRLEGGGGPSDSVPTQSVADPPSSICGLPQDEFHGPQRRCEALGVGRMKGSFSITIELSSNWRRNFQARITDLGEQDQWGRGLSWQTGDRKEGCQKRPPVDASRSLLGPSLGCLLHKDPGSRYDRETSRGPRAGSSMAARVSPQL